jgi:hypothetical protein
MTAPPQNVEAEQAVLGAVLLSQDAHTTARALLSDDDWYQPRHHLIWVAAGALQARGEAVDAITVAAELGRTGGLVKSGGFVYLHTLMHGVVTVANVDYHAEIIAEKAVLRRLSEAGTRISQIAASADSIGLYSGAVSDAIERAKAELTASTSMRTSQNATDVDVYVLLAEDLPFDWVVPGLLTKGERVLLTAAEGLGKSTLLRQIGVCAAAGLHPFKFSAMEPRKVLVIDCENGRRLSQDRYGPLVRQAARSGRPIAEEQLRLDIQPSGYDFLSSIDAQLVLRMVERFQPDIVMIGPVYRLHRGDPNEEQSARRVSVVLDQMREISGAAIMTEAHMAKAGASAERPINPVGSGLWMRWPEFGYGLVLDKDSDLETERRCAFKPWRGPREERAWPRELMSGQATVARVPWPFVDTARYGGSPAAPEAPSPPPSEPESDPSMW